MRTLKGGVREVFYSMAIKLNFRVNVLKRKNAASKVHKSPFSQKTKNWLRQSFN